jgi:uncharacterized membrane protein HdeD (DUF308 family)
MKTATIVGVLLIVLGIAVFVIPGITYTTREKVLDIGPIEASTEKEKTVSLPPVLGGLALVGGVLLVIVGARGRS